ncbi:MAG: 4,5-DOPA dioxygenase extradiol [Candidatus Sericytochromatia bacterium]
MKWNEKINKRMPILFLGHGNPMNAIEENKYSIEWEKLGKELPKPDSILCISAHWLTKGVTAITAMEKPRTIHDFGGFPKALFDVQYPASGSPELAKYIKENIKSTNILLDEKEWGLDHGTWSILCKMYPNADIPVIQLSIDYSKNAQFHYNLGKELSFLRDKGVMIIGSGNIIHNLRLADLSETLEPYDWCKRFDLVSRDLILSNNHNSLINYENLGQDALLSIPTPDHYFPLLYILGLQDEKDKISFPIEGLSFRSGSMRSVLYQ